MEYGLGIPTRGPLAERRSIEAIARRAEDWGFSWLSVSDHLIVPRSIDSRYPYCASGTFPGADGGDCLEQFTLLTFLAAITKRARLLSSVTVAPHRGAIETAKMIATIDRLCDGRFTFGVGAGWMEEEFKAIQAPPFAARGRVSDEIIQACRILWREDEPAFDGEHIRFSNITFLPKPVQRPGVPIWIGGESKAAKLRTVRFGDAWFPIHTNPRHPLDTLDRYRKGVQELHALAEKHGRDPAEIGLALWSNLYDETRPEAKVDGKHHLLTGSTEAIIDDIGNLGEIGVRQTLLNFQRGDLERSLAAMQRFAEDVMPKVERPCR